MILLNNNFDQQVENIKTDPNVNYIILNMYIYIFFISSKFRRAYIIHTVSNYKENTTVINKRTERIYRSY